MEGCRRKPIRDTAVHREVCGVQSRIKRKDRNKSKASAKKQCDGGGTHRDLRGVKRRSRNKNVSARPNGLRENAETVISCGGPGPARNKKKVYQESRGGGRRCTDVPLWQSSRE